MIIGLGAGVNEAVVKIDVANVWVGSPRPHDPRKAAVVYQLFFKRTATTPAGPRARYKFKRVHVRRRCYPMTLVPEFHSGKAWSPIPLLYEVEVA